MTVDDNRTSLIQSILSIQSDLNRFFAEDRSIPLFATTLTIQQLKVLMIVSFEGKVSSQALAKQLGVTLATATGIVDRLVAQDLVCRSEDPSDRRVRHITFTARGSQVADELIDAGSTRMSTLLNELKVSTLHHLHDALDEIREASTVILKRDQRRD